MTTKHHGTNEKKAHKGMKLRNSSTKQGKGKGAKMSGTKPLTHRGKSRRKGY